MRNISEMRSAAIRRTHPVPDADPDICRHVPAEAPALPALPGWEMIRRCDR